MTSIEIVNTKETPAIAIREKVKVTEIPAVMERMYGELFPHLGRDVKCAGPPFAFYHSWEGEIMDIEVGFPISGKGIEAGNVKAIKLPAARAAVATHIGPYDRLTDTYNIMMEWMKANGHTPAPFMWEEYLNSPQEVPPDKLMTRLYWPIL
ncbi:MAG TPA: GyrI-like domain-containing protein [Methanomassiliicoccales archaeon]|nr:GyrI-like domain-containing protein [Methanomassiliicoccales archaeon]